MYRGHPSDKAGNVHHAWKRQCCSKDFLHKEAEHTSDASFDGIHRNN